MRTSLYLAACVAFTALLGGCADQGKPATRTVSQKPLPGQTYSAPGSNGQNVATSRLDSAPPLTVTSAPYVASTASAPAVVAPAQQIAKIKAAILLPLTGHNAPLGQAMLNAAQQAVFDAAGTNFELQPHDTGEGAAEAARAAVNGGVQIIIGPLFAADVPPVKAVAQQAGLEMLPLSTDTSLAEHGVYVMGLAPGAQVERVIAYASSHGARNFAAIVPSTPYGALVGSVFNDAVVRAGGKIVDYQTYDPAQHGEADRAKALAAHRNDIDAVFLPETGPELKTIVDQMAAGGFDNAHLHLLGTGLWDGQALGKQSALLIGALYAAPDPALRRGFIASYQAAYGNEPPRLATLAYDATALAAILAKQGQRYDDAQLTNPNGFAGLDGIFRLTPSGGVERAMAVAEITSDGVRIVDPAPTTFVARKANH